MTKVWFAVGLWLCGAAALDQFQCWTWLAAASGQCASALAAGVPGHQDPCACRVVNSSTVATASGSCMLPGQGSVPCFDVSTPTYPEGGMPQNGVCHFPPVCDGLSKCTYKNMQVTVTIASCATGCAVPNAVRWQQVRPGNHGNTNGTQSVNSQQSYTIVWDGVSNLCGTADTSVFLVFYRTDGTEAFKVEFKWGCGQCQAAIP